MSDFHDDISKIITQAEALTTLIFHDQSFTNVNPQIVENSLWLLLNLLEQARQLLSTKFVDN